MVTPVWLPTLSILDINSQVEESETKEKVIVPLLMQNCAPRIEGIESNEKLDIAMRPDGVSCTLIYSANLVHSR